MIVVSSNFNIMVTLIVNYCECLSCLEAVSGLSIHNHVHKSSKLIQK